MVSIIYGAYLIMTDFSLLNDNNVIYWLWFLASVVVQIKSDTGAE